MREPRILLITDAVGGVWDFCMVLAASADTRVTLLVLGEPSPAHREAAAAARVELVSAPLKLEWMHGSEADISRTRSLVADVARDIRADVVHANQFAAACIDVDVPVVLTIHSDVLSWRRWTLTDGASRTPRVEPIPEEWRLYYRLVREALGRADSVVAVSAFLAAEVRELYGVDRAIEVIHNGWPTPSQGGGPDKERRTRTFVAGRIWDAAKNINLTAEAAHGWSPGHVYLAGEQIHPDTGESIAAPALLEPLGVLNRSELDSWLDRSAIYLSPARYDPFGLLPVQAALRGCALLLSDIPSYRELWEGAALFFRSDDANDLRRSWQILLEDAGLRSELRSRAWERARTRFSSTRMQDRYRALYAGIPAMAA